MAATPADLSLVTLSADLLAYIVEAYGAKGIDLPDRRYYTLGTPVNDCEQLVVAWQQSYLGSPGDEASVPQRCDVAPRTAVFSVQLTREMPVVSQSGKAPAPDKIQERSAIALLNAHVLFELVMAFDPFGAGTITTVDVVEVSGGLSCIQVQTAIAIP